MPRSNRSGRKYRLGKLREGCPNHQLRRVILFSAPHTQVLGDLIRAGLVESVAGPGGGYSLARRPDDVSLLEVVEAAEGPIRNTKCLMRGGPCHWHEACSLHAAWAEAQDKMVSQLAKTSFAQLARQDAAHEKRKGIVSDPLATTSKRR